jgi:predicted O-linked N-acetylglucosamine transferase (SPINDLY family)
LRVGYVSPDFHGHSVSYFFEPILAAHRERGEVEVYCYAEQRKRDAMTQRLKALATGWREIQGRSDAEVAAQIKADGIDVLIDLAGHTGENRLGVFTYKPAPVQATYLGYFATTGLSAMDYWISDAVLTPADTVERASEEIERLPRCCLVYTAPEEAPAVAERPTGEPVVFGNFNDLSKAGAGSVEAWSEILRRVPGSRLVLKARQLSDKGQHEPWLQRFEAEGIERDRIELRGYAPSKAAHLEQYADVDIALDMMPRTGGATTAEALWMGVPVISLAGRRFIERLSASMLNEVGLDWCVSETVTGYVDCAVALANDEPRRRRLRSELRERVRLSSLGNGEALTRDLEQAYARMWRQWCESDQNGAEIR